MSPQSDSAGPVAFFRATADGLDPLPLARSGWGGGQLRGIAMGAVLARAVEQAQAAAGRSDLRPARWTLDLFRAAQSRTTTIATTVVRSGRRLCLIDALAYQDDDRPVARASALLLRPSELPSTTLWQTATHPEPPSVARATGTERVYHDGVNWLEPFAVPAGDGPKALWQYSIPTVEGEVPSPFQAVAGACDLINATTNLGDGGLEFINADATLSLSRLPTTLEVGIGGLSRTEHNGIVATSAVVFDTVGQFGAVTMSGLRNPPIAMELPRA